MKAVPFGAYLQSRRRMVENAEAPGPIELPEPEPAPNLDSVRQQAQQAGYAEGYAAAVAEYEERLASQQALLADQVETARRQTLAREARAYKRKAAREMGKMRAEIEVQIAPILKALFAGAIEERARRETLATLRELLHMRKLGDIRIAGPQKHLLALREGLGAAAEAMDFVIADQPDISISFGQTSIRTKIGVWKEKLEQLSGSETHV